MIGMLFIFMVCGWLFTAFRLSELEDKFYKKHASDIRHRDREVNSRSEQIRVLKQRVHNLDRKLHGYKSEYIVKP